MKAAAVFVFAVHITVTGDAFLCSPAELGITLVQVDEDNGEHMYVGRKPLMSHGYVWIESIL